MFASAQECRGRILKKQAISVSAVLAVLTIGAKAQDVDTAADAEIRLDTILVSEGLTPVEQEKSGRAFTVISGEELEHKQIRHVADALRQVPGFAVSRSGQAGGLTQVRVRGAEANHLLVMVDGVEVNELSTGEFDFGSLLVDGIDRIEVLRGPQSAFWGSNALAGVVNIITKRGERNGFAGSARSEVGSDGSWLGGVSLRGGGETYDVALSGAFQRVGGVNISDFGDEKDGDRNATLNARFAADLSSALTVDGTFRLMDQKTDVDPQDFTWGSPTYGRVIDGPDETGKREIFGSLGATHVSLDGALTQKARFTAGDMYRENLASGFLSWSDGNRYTGSYQASYQFETPGALDASHQLTAGYEWERETFAPSHLTQTLERDTNSLVGEYRGAFLDRFFVNAGVRHDLNDRFGDATTYSLSGAWKITPATRLHASIGTGVTAPTFFEQFGYVPGSFVGNPGLVPEKSTGWDVGVEQRFFHGMVVTDITYFHQDLTNEIVAAPTTVINQNGQSNRRGVEVAATLDLFNGFTATATYTYTKSTEQTAAGGQRLDEVRRPQHSGSFSTAYQFYENRARVFGEVVFNGKMYDQDFAEFPALRVALPAYTVVNVGGSFKFTENLEAYGRVDNLLDADYEEVFDYNSPGLTAFVGVKGTF